MRIVGGKHRGRKLEGGPDQAIRPTADRTREALFNLLAHNPNFLGPHGPLPQAANVLDVFAGSGALGLEALSRGAKHVSFIDNRPQSLKIARANAAMLNETEHCDFFQRDAVQPGLAPSRHYDLALIDPPYNQGLAAVALQALAQEGWLAGNAFAIVETARGENFAPPQHFIAIDERVYGAAKLNFLRWKNPSTS